MYLGVAYTCSYMAAAAAFFVLHEFYGVSIEIARTVLFFSVQENFACENLSRDNELYKYDIT